MTQLAQVISPEDGEDYIEVEVGTKRILFANASELCQWRAQTLLQKEPFTIQWLDALGPGDVLFDVGANIGVYTLYAAIVRGCHVYAFEPEAYNFALLNRNLYLNGLGMDQVVALPLALSDVEGFDALHMSDMRIGGSCHSVHEEVSFDLTPKKSKFSQACVVDYLDRLVAEGVIANPDAIKIDVDGFEHKVINGASEILTGESLRTLIIETNPFIPEHVEMMRDLDELGYEFDVSQQSAAARKEGAFKGVGEVIFQREKSAIELLRIDSPVVSEPTPHVAQDEIFEPSFYQRMLEHFPMPSQMRPLEETGRVKGYKERFVVLLTDADMNAYLDPERAKFWRAFRDRLFSKRVARQLMDLFPILDGFEGEVEPDGLLVDDRCWYNITPHTDVPRRILSVLFYLADDDVNESSLGTTLYVPKDPKFTDPAGAHQPREYFEPHTTVAYYPNRALIFPRTDTSFHGVERIKNPDPNRKLVIFNLRKTS